MPLQFSIDNSDKYHVNSRCGNLTHWFFIIPN